MTATSLRKHIVETISRSGYALKRFKDMEAVAREIGVLPEVLEEAYRKRVRRERKHRMDATARFKEGTYTSYSLTLHTHEYVKALVKDESNRRKMNHSTFLRSLVHFYLKGSTEPEMHVNRGWYFDGHTYYNSDKGNLKVNITYGAHVALRARAIWRKVPVHTLYKSIVRATLVGDFAPPGSLQAVRKSQMFSEPFDYWIPSPEAVHESMDYVDQIHAKNCDSS